MSNQIELRVPDIGDFDTVEVIEVLVSAGESVSTDQSLITLESDKASMEIPSTHEGVISKIKVSVGDRLSKGDLIGLLDVAASAETPTDIEESKSGNNSDAPDPGDKTQAVLSLIHI